VGPWRRFVVAAIIAAADVLGATASSSAAAPDLYGSDVQFPNNKLVKIDPATAGFQTIGSFPVAITGLAYASDLDQLYGLSPETHRVYRIDRATAGVVAIGVAPFTFGNANGLAYDSRRSRLLATANLEPASSNELFAIDPIAGTYTALTTITGAHNVEGLGYDTASDTLYGVADTENQLVRNNPTTGVATPLAQLPAKNWRGLEYDPFRQLFNASISAGGEFYEIKLTMPTPTPTVQLIGVTSPGTQGLALTPEPTTATTCATLLAAHACFGRRRARLHSAEK
jgi:hypothetical protein